MPDTSYRISRTDGQTIEAAKSLLWKIVRSRLVTPDDLIALARTLKVLQELPALSTPEKISIELSGAAKQYDQKTVLSWWNVTLEETAISISSGVRPETPADGGGEVGFHWSITPDSESKSGGVLAELGVYDQDIGLPAQVREMNLEQPGYRLKVVCQEPEVKPGQPAAEQEVAPVDESEATLLKQADFKKARQNPQFYFSSPQKCNLCGADLGTRSLFVDGQVGGSGEWRDMCSQCFFANSAKVAWGKGQLYQRQSDGKWLLVGGFPPQ